MWARSVPERAPQNVSLADAQTPPWCQHGTHEEHHPASARPTSLRGLGRAPPLGLDASRSTGHGCCGLGQPGCSAPSQHRLPLISQKTAQQQKEGGRQLMCMQAPPTTPRHRPVDAGDHYRASAIVHVCWLSREPSSQSHNS
jgi:hypothetical protein